MLTVRLFESEREAQAGAARLIEEGFPRDSVSVISASPGSESVVVAEAKRSGRLPGSHAEACTAALKRGRAIVTVAAPFAHELQAIELLEASGAVETETLPVVSPRDPSPFSDFLGLPVLSRSRTTTQLARKPYTFPLWLGLGLTSRKAAPLSGMFGLKTLSRPKRPWTSSFGLPLLTRSSGPVLGLKAISTPKRPWTSSFGLPLLSRNSAPMSSIFGLPLLTRRHRSDD